MYRESKGEDTSHVKERQARLDLVSLVPAANQVDAAGKKTSFEDTQQSSRNRQDLPIGRKAHADRDGSPANDDERKPISRSYAANDKIRGKLKQEVSALSDTDQGNYPGKKTRRATL
jgi:cysteinyl-tRNA synthetase